MKIILNIPDADKAKEIVMQGNYERAQIQSKAIETAIAQAIAKGDRGVHFNGPLDDPVVAALRAKGYAVKQGNDRNESYTGVTW